MQMVKEKGEKKGGYGSSLLRGKEREVITFVKLCVRTCAVSVDIE